MHEPSILPVWEQHEITLHSANTYANPYTDIEVWVELRGPSFAKRVRGFWDGGNTFKIRVVATSPGEWSWRSESTPADPGLDGQSGAFTARTATEAELAANPNYRGFIGATANGRGLQYADGTPFFYLADTWWATPTDRFAWYDDDTPRPLGPDAGFKDYVQQRKRQGFNGVGLIAVQPAWANDGHPAHIHHEDGTVIRIAWPHPHTGSAKDMCNEGGRPFEFPGRVPGYESVFPDLDRLNPEYYRYMDRKIAYLCAQGFVPFIETSRRDTAQVWKKYHDFPRSYARFIRYIFARYHAWNTILSPIHYDTPKATIASREYNEVCNLVFDQDGKPPFGNLVSANACPSSLVNFGAEPDSRWIDLHQTGNHREHYTYWYLTDIHRSNPPKPALNGEPYYASYNRTKHNPPMEPDSERDRRYVRSGMYGSFLSGGYAGHIYGCEGVWGADIEPGSDKIKLWEAMTFGSGDQVRHLRTFAFARGTRYREMIPEADLLVPSQQGAAHGFEGWAYCSHTPQRDLFMLYFERGCPKSMLRGGLLERTYTARWFDPRNGTWGASVEGLTVDTAGLLRLPELPSDDDWGMIVELVE